VNRAKGVSFFQPTEFMLRRRVRVEQQAVEQQAPRHHVHRSQGRPAKLVEPIPAQGARWAKPGERPPSKFAPGQNDTVIEQFDAYAAQWRGGKVPHGRRW